jgi:hypothetical protein
VVAVDEHDAGTKPEAARKNAATLPRTNVMRPPIPVRRAFSPATAGAPGSTSSDTSAAGLPASSSASAMATVERP